jgi:hypothetical protein
MSFSITLGRSLLVLEADVWVYRRRPRVNLMARLARWQCVHVGGFGWFFEVETENRRFA